MDILKLAVKLPAVTSGGAIKYILNIVRSDTGFGELPAAEIQDIPLTQAEVVMEAVQDSTIKLSIVAVDEAGNQSPPTEAEFTVLDTIPPSLTGDFSVRAVGERTVEAPTPIVPPLPPVEEAPVVSVIEETIVTPPTPVVDEPQTIVTPPVVEDAPETVVTEVPAVEVVEDTPAVVIEEVVAEEAAPVVNEEQQPNVEDAQG